MLAGLLNPQQNGDDSQTPPPTPRSSSAHNDDSDSSQPPDKPGPPGSALAIRSAISQSQTPVKPTKKDTPSKDMVPGKDVMFVENETKTEPGTPSGQVVTGSPYEARGACSLDGVRPGDTFYSDASTLNIQPRGEPEQGKDVETGEGTSNASVENVAKPVRTRRNTPKNTEELTPGSRRVLQGRQRPLGETFTLSRLAFESSAISLPSIPDSDPRFHDLDTRSPVSSLPLRRYPCYPNLNSLLFPDSELQQTHSDNLHGRSKSGLNAGKSYYFLLFNRNIFAIEP